MRNTAHRYYRVRGVVAAIATVALVTSACADEANDNADTEQDEQNQQDGETDGGGSDAVTQAGTLAPPASAEDAYTYDEELAPEGAELAVEAHGDSDATTIMLTVEGLVADRGYAVHAHTDQCGEQGEDAGPHYQDEVDPAATDDQPSVDPDYANPDNEIWLDLETDGDGNGESTADVPFGFAEKAPGSVIVHEEEQTATGEGQAGEAGDRLACLTVPFDSLQA